MVGWRERRIRRRLAGLIGPEEDIRVAERLGLGGWWVTSDEALYILGGLPEPSRLPLAEIVSVQVAEGRMTVQVTITTSAGEIAVGDLRPGSAVLRRLLARDPETGGHEE